MTQAYTRAVGGSAPIRVKKLLSLVAAGTCVAAAMSACRGGGSASVPSPTPTADAVLVTRVASATPEIVASATPTAAPRSTVAVSTPTPTETASGGNGGPITFSPGEGLLPSDLFARGVGKPGRGPFTGGRLIIPTIRVDAPIVAVKVGVDGSMPPPPSVSDVAWYDFSGFSLLGGSPGDGGNVVLAGDAGRVGVGPGVFWSLALVTPGDYVEIVLTSGEVCYGVEFNKLASTTEVDWTYLVRATAEESVTIITAGADASSRRVVWGRRTSCAGAPTATPTPTPPP
jgi:hypothetical protein